MKILLLAVLAAILLTTTLASSDSWSWNEKQETHMINKRGSNEDETKNEESIDLNESQGRQLYSSLDILSNDTVLDEIIDSIIHRNREGRNLDEFSEICADPNVQEALDKGDNVQARNLIREKLCSLGLMQCDIESKRPFRPPGLGIYKPPYGPPRPMPPRPSLNMGPPRKVGYEGPIISKPFLGGPPSSLFNGPPGPIYSGHQGPVYNGPYLDSSPPSSLSDSGITFSKPPPGSIIYGSKPPGQVYEGADAPYDFDHVVGEKIQVEHSQSSFDHHQISPHGGITGKPTIVVNAQGGAASTGAHSAGQIASALQQHVHHHFHHIEGSNGKAPVVPVALPVPVPLSSGNSAANEYAAITSSTAGFSPLSPGYDIKNEISHTSSLSSNFNGASGLASLSGATQGLIAGNTINGFDGINGGIRPVGGLYENVKPVSETGHSTYGSGFTSGLGLNTASYGNTGLGTSVIYGGNSGGNLGGNLGGLHSLNSDYFNKDLQINGGNSLYGYGQQNKFIAQSQQYGGQFNQYTNTDDYNGVETSRQHVIDCVCVPYNQCPAADRLGRKEDLILPIDPRNLGSDIEALPEDSKNVTMHDQPTKDENESNKDETKKLSKRQIADKKVSEEENEAASDVEPRLTISNSFPQTSVNLQKRKVLPTFGVSFGLPYPTGIYPPNAFGGYPAQNPYFGAISPNGLNLGLVNVNPLLSLQVTKTEHGEKVVKPLVNLHVTPNEQIIHKVGSLFKAKKEHIFNQHEHFHHHNHYRPPSEEFFPHPPPHIHHGPIHEFNFPKPIHEPFDSSHIGGHYGFAYPPSGPHFPGPFNPPSGLGFEHPHPHPPYDFHPYNLYERSYNVSKLENRYALNFDGDRKYRQEKNFRFNDASNLLQTTPTQVPGNEPGSKHITFPNSRRRRSLQESKSIEQEFGKTNNYFKEKRQAFYGGRPQQCSAGLVCCRRPYRPQQQQQQQQLGRCGTRNAHGITGRIKNPVYVDGDSEFGEYPWQVAILKKDPKESVYVCGGTIIDHLHIITAAHCVKTFGGFDLRVRLGEWDVNHDVEFFPYIERDIVSVHVHPEYYAGTLDNDLAILKLDRPIDFVKNPHISPACLPDKYSDFTGARCWTTGWGKDAFGEYGKYQNILKEVDVPIISQQQCQNQLRHTRLGYNYQLHPGFICAGGEEGKDACKGDGGGPMVCERNGIWQIVGVVSWGIGCGQVNVPGVYVRVSHYLDWIQQITRNY